MSLLATSQVQPNSDKHDKNKYNIILGHYVIKKWKRSVWASQLSKRRGNWLDNSGTYFFLLVWAMNLKAKRTYGHKHGLWRSTKELDKSWKKRVSVPQALKTLHWRYECWLLNWRGYKFHKHYLVVSKTKQTMKQKSSYFPLFSSPSFYIKFSKKNDKD